MQSTRWRAGSSGPSVAAVSAARTGAAGAGTCTSSRLATANTPAGLVGIVDGGGGGAASGAGSGDEPQAATSASAPRTDKDSDAKCDDDMTILRIKVSAMRSMFRAAARDRAGPALDRGDFPSRIADRDPRGRRRDRCP
jgi:hypothetical protein